MIISLLSLYIQSEDEDEEGDDGFDEYLRYGHVLSMYQCLNVSQKKTSIEKEPPK